MLHTACPTHPAQTSRDACHRCGTYACDLCLAPGSRRESLCLSCERAVAEQNKRPIETSARALRVLLGSYAALELLTAAVQWFGRGQRFAGRPEEVAHSPLLILHGFLMLGAFPLFLLAGVTWCVWFRRANGSLQKREMALEFGPNAWGWFFVPFANLYAPYRSIVELYTRATNSVVAPRVFVVWWSLWLLRAVSTWAQVASRELSIFGALGALVAMAAAVTAAMVVKEVTRALAGPPPGPELAEFAPALGSDFA